MHSCIASIQYVPFLTPNLRLEKEMTSCQYLFEVYALSRLIIMVFVCIEYSGVVPLGLVSERDCT
jgi:hypothetical protein